MRRIHWIWVVMALCLLLPSACRKVDGEEERISLSADNKIRFRIGGTETRSVTEVTTANLSSFYVTAVHGADGSNVLDWGNVMFTSDGAVPPATPVYTAEDMYWPSPNPEYKFYCANQRMDFTSAGCKVSADGTRDVVCAYQPVSAYKNSPSDTQLSFEHIYARLSDVNITADDEITISNVTVWIMNAKTGGVYDLRTGCGQGDGTGWSQLTPSYETNTPIYAYAPDLDPNDTHTEENDILLVPGDYYLMCSWTARLGAFAHAYSDVVSNSPVTMTGGKRNNISVTLSGNTEGLSFTVAIAPWGNNDEDAGDVEVDYALPGVFSVAADKKVRFAKGNLRTFMFGTVSNTYDYTPWSWSLHPHQYGYVGDAAGNTSFARSTYVDLYSWTGASASYNNYGLTAYTGSEAARVGNSVEDALKTPWERISLLRQDIGSYWSLLTSSEWNYLMFSRSGAASKYAYARIYDSAGTLHNGLILLPDSWTLPPACTLLPGSGHAFSDNTFDDRLTTGGTQAWCDMETAGAVFLPASGDRVGTTVSSVGAAGWYNTASPDPGSTGSRNSFRFTSASIGIVTQSRSIGHAVRLVRVKVE